jgi:hypothetical protein
MASRISVIRSAVKDHITTGFAAAGAVTFSDTPVAFDTVPADQFPFAVVIVGEEEPERLAFKQERRRVICNAVVGVVVASGATLSATREVVDVGIQGVRDAIFADDQLSALVDDVSVSSGVAHSGEDDSIVYGELDIQTEEIF